MDIMLLLDKCEQHDHKNLQLKHIQVSHLSLNNNSYMKPLDQGIIHCMKHAYYYQCKK
jgi:hypothetical protein